MTESRMSKQTRCLRDFNQFCFLKKWYGVRNSHGPKLAKTQLVRPRWVWDIFFLKKVWEKSKITWRKSMYLGTISNSLPQWQDINDRWSNLTLSLSTFFSGGYPYTRLLSTLSMKISMQWLKSLNSSFRTESGKICKLLWDWVNRISTSFEHVPQNSLPLKRDFPLHCASLWSS